MTTKTVSGPTLADVAFCDLPPTPQTQNNYCITGSQQGDILVYTQFSGNPVTFGKQKVFRGTGISTQKR